MGRVLYIYLISADISVMGDTKEHKSGLWASLSNLVIEAKNISSPIRCFAWAMGTICIISTASYLVADMATYQFALAILGILAILSCGLIVADLTKKSPIGLIGDPSFLKDLVKSPGLADLIKDSISNVPLKPGIRWNYKRRPENKTTDNTIRANSSREEE